MDSDRPVIGFCIYCKQEIYADEAFVKSGQNLYHASNTEEHDNCYLLMIDEIEGEE